MMFITKHMPKSPFFLQMKICVPSYDLSTVFTDVYHDIPNYDTNGLVKT